MELYNGYDDSYDPQDYDYDEKDVPVIDDEYIAENSYDESDYHGE